MPVQLLSTTLSEPSLTASKLSSAELWEGDRVYFQRKKVVFRKNYEDRMQGEEKTY